DDADANHIVSSLAGPKATRDDAGNEIDLQALRWRTCCNADALCGRINSTPDHGSAFPQHGDRPMFDRIANGWELTKQSFNVLRLDKELLLFPLVSGLSCLAVLASFVLPLWNSPYAQVVLNEHQVPKDPVAWVILFAFYFVNYFVIVYFNSALVACA